MVDQFKSRRKTIQHLTSSSTGAKTTAALSTQEAVEALAESLAAFRGALESTLVPARSASPGIDIRLVDDHEDSQVWRITVVQYGQEWTEYFEVVNSQIPETLLHAAATTLTKARRYG